MTQTLDRTMAHPAVPVIGDLLRLAFHASRFHPDRDVRAGIGAAFDRMLDAASTPPHGAADVGDVVARHPGTPLAPMVANGDDRVLAARLWRYCEFAFAGTSPAVDDCDPAARVFLGSADAVGAGHGVMLSRQGSRSQTGRSLGPAINRLLLGIARHADGIAMPACGDRATVAVDRRAGVTIEIRLAEAPGGGPGLGAEDWLSPLAPAKGGSDLPRLHEAGIRVQARSPRWLRIWAASPEGAIRLSAACADRAIVHIPIGAPPPGKPDATAQSLTPGAFDVLVRLAPLDEPGAALHCVRSSRTGMLADWMRFNCLPLAPDLAPELRAAIAAHYART